ncbi:class GN sortase [Alkalimarinus alittae]|uniref:Class GN sortase n=1 Tax=Alkalimarinus alittae TaxID=2961619 RepID=A0ABY6N384_9ALTE|nr:class GN sortase [Alkalimarinus alittae]UZE96578.1 class GN sortase [Alkalimarinus alittae]
MKKWILLMTVGGLLFGMGGAIQLKAVAAQWMLEYAWQNTLDHHQRQKPWPWADIWPVGKLQLGSADSMIVLDSVSGQALAFGPGRVPGTGGTEHKGLTVLAGHRDTHFSSLKTLKIGDEISVQDTNGVWRVYTVSEIDIINTETHMIDLTEDTQASPQLMLVTCYPFDAIQAGGPLRYVVTANEAV